MFNFLWGVLFVVVNFSLFLVCYRSFGKSGLYAWVGVATVLANVQVVKTIDMFGFVMTLGNTMYGTIYLASDLLNEKYGEKAAKKAVWFGFFTLLMMMIVMQMAIVFERQADDLGHSSLETIFGLIPQIALGSLVAYFVSQFLDVRIYSLLKRIFPERNQLWIRNNGSTAVSQLVDSLIFCSIAFAGHYPFEVWLEIFITTYLIKFVISAASTPVIYIARNFPAKSSE
ncbi:queuosine precursor transporter [Paenibacillus oenotherae]|uniref:Probable queuosine precursor transporter n=1 Tax=Paenibacillus oenotherae TaxID=1435645 RepID=A0ABS7D837_9BACL|nr:queuosine precursor transporter [Paenibacillus oenotherae]MBW7476050.1 queuosine precursor transporter [Paenibacillus oenotherae]